jgi:hypothetical protein
MKLMYDGQPQPANDAPETPTAEEPQQTAQAQAAIAGEERE